MPFNQFNCYTKFHLNLNLFEQGKRAHVKKFIYFPEIPYEITLSAAITSCNLILTGEKQTNTHTRSRHVQQCGIYTLRYFFVIIFVFAIAIGIRTNCKTKNTNEEHSYQEPSK